MRTTFADTMVREPDFIDPVTQTACWIGDQGALEVPLSVLDETPRLAHNAGWFARSRIAPADHGISVVPFAPDFIHPTFGEIQLKGDPGVTRETLWRLLQDTVGARLTFEGVYDVEHIHDFQDEVALLADGCKRVTCACGETIDSHRRVYGCTHPEAI